MTELAPTDTSSDIDTFLGRAETRTFDLVDSLEPAVRAACRLYLDAGGKRLRPRFAVLAALCVGDFSDEVLDMAAAVELLHTSSLCHDDVIDDAVERRWQPSINCVFGDRAAVFAGNVLFFRAMEVFAALGNDITPAVSTAVQHLWRGEEREAQGAFAIDRSREDYFEVAIGKTATMFALPARLGAMLGGGETADVERLEEFGKAFGVAFQILDDVRDFVAPAAMIGKRAGSDVREGVYTLPLIDALADPDRRAELDPLLHVDPDDMDVEAIVAAIRAAGTFTSALDAAESVYLRGVDGLGWMIETRAGDQLAAMGHAALAFDRLRGLL